MSKAVISEQPSAETDAIPVLDQWLAASTVEDFKALQITSAQLLRIRQEIIAESRPKVLWVSLGMLLLHLPTLYMLMQVGNLTASLVIGGVLVAIHLTAVGAAVRPGLVEFETSPRAYARSRLLVGCVLAAAVGALWVPFIVNGLAIAVVMPLVTFATAMALYATLSPLLVVSWLGRSIDGLRVPDQPRPQKYTIDPSGVAQGTLPPASSVNSAAAPPSPQSFWAQATGTAIGFVLLMVLATLFTAVTGWTIPFPFARPGVHPSVPRVPPQHVPLIR